MLSIFKFTFAFSWRRSIRRRRRNGAVRSSPAVFGGDGLDRDEITEFRGGHGGGVEGPNGVSGTEFEDNGRRERENGRRRASGDREEREMMIDFVKAHHWLNLILYLFLFFWCCVVLLFSVV